MCKMQRGPVFSIKTEHDSKSEVPPQEPGTKEHTSVCGSELQTYMVMIKDLKSQFREWKTS